MGLIIYILFTSWMVLGFVIMTEVYSFNWYHIIDDLKGYKGVTSPIFRIGYIVSLIMIILFIPIFWVSDKIITIYNRGG